MDNNKAHCPHCGVEIIEGNDKCHYCGYNFNNNINENYTNIDNNSIYSTENIKNSINSSKKKNNNKMGCLGHFIYLMFMGPFLFIGIVLFGFGIFSYICQYYEIKDLTKTTGYLYEFYDCDISDYEVVDEDTSCRARYKYTVNDKDYLASPNLTTNQRSFNKKENVYYNPSNPSDSYMCIDLSLLLIMGSIFLAVSIFFYIITRKIAITINNSINKKTT